MQQEGERIMEIRKITGIVPADKRAVETAFGSIEPQPVACCNWPEQYPYTPEVSFRMFHTGAYLMLRFDVREQWTMARVTEDNGEVWTDSCVEFFIAPTTAATTTISNAPASGVCSWGSAESANTPHMPRPGSWKASCATRASGRVPSPNTKATTAGRWCWPSRRRRCSCTR